ncbi:MAG TPA: hypothetical protein VMT87_15205 [Vicinamibacteria bacterium]|nr:hypothetical protein [Vicinamibacteria bacterium]
MQLRASFILAGALLCAVPARDSHAREGKKKDVPVYTDDDLRRVSPLRGQTGGTMEAAPSPPTEAAAGAGRRAERDEAYWRREWERLRDRVQPLRDRAEELRGQIEQRRRRPGVRPYSDPGIASMQGRLAALEARIREAEDRLHERARRAGALPGWLR